MGVVADIWGSSDSEIWIETLNRYWSFVKPDRMAVEKAFDTLDADSVNSLSPQEWYSFLHDEYFLWKYTSPNRYATTTKQLERYLVETGGLSALYDIKRKIFGFDRDDVLLGIEIAKQIHGLGTAGASGLLAVLFPEHFGTVDQFVVKALLEIENIPYRALLEKMNPESLSPRDGAILIGIMKHKAEELRTNSRLADWTPRRIDMVLWTVGR